MDRVEVFCREEWAEAATGSSAADRSRGRRARGSHEADSGLGSPLYLCQSVTLRSGSHDYLKFDVVEELEYRLDVSALCVTSLVLISVRSCRRGSD